MNITIAPGIGWDSSADQYDCWMATCSTVIYRSWAMPCYSVRGVGDTPSEALQDMLLKCLEEGDRSDEVIAMLNAEFTGQDWWHEVKEDMEVYP